MHWFFVHASLALAAIASARSISMYSPQIEAGTSCDRSSAYTIFYSTAIELTGNQVKLQEPICHWAGYSPFCRGHCDTAKGQVECDRSDFGDGKECITGSKALCCVGRCPGDDDAISKLSGAVKSHVSHHLCCFVIMSS